jgi:hypothetical protein
MSEQEKIAVTESFIAAIKDHQVILILQHPQHKNLPIVRNCWEEILLYLRDSFPKEALERCRLANVNMLKQ